SYLLEQSLSVDNLFVFILVFKYFKVPLEYQNRVLSYGIAGAVIFRAVLIILGVATIQVGCSPMLPLLFLSNCSNAYKFLMFCRVLKQ
uniref:Uncharacterized protein n=1 Tax=Aegilops tauschii subsp. strangulata TaxID=200361 RepID=A0A452XRP9_AEGTS